LQQLPALQALFRYQSGRVIALGRIILVVLFLLAIWFAPTDPETGVVETYTLLILYALLAVAVAVGTWRNWWLDARLALPTHAVDMAVFTGIVFSQNGTTSPFFLFFVLPLLSAAIRWTWRETAMTATALVLLFMIAGLLLAGTGGFELDRFVLRAGNLVILSLLLIWFGIHQHFTRLFFPVEDFKDGLAERENPIAKALEFAMQATQARCGALVLGASGEEPADGFAISGGELRGFSAERPLVRGFTGSTLLFDVGRDRALTRPPGGSFHFFGAHDVIDPDEARCLGLTAGLLAEVRTEMQQGWLILWDIPDLSTDYIDIGSELGRGAGAILDRQALLHAIEAGAAARTRLSLARDVHDSIVQFLAGAAFRVEAIKRADRTGAKIGPELDELKRLLVEEQGEIREFLLALRRDRELGLAEAVAELSVLADRLSQQWAIDCSVTDDGRKASIPIRLQLDLQQMLREAVANAVRHGGANRIDFGLAVENGSLHIKVADNGSGFSGKNGEAAVEPSSLKERVERAHGTIRLVSEPGSTNIFISLPLAGAAS